MQIICTSPLKFFSAGRMPFLPPNLQHQSIKGAYKERKEIICHGLTPLLLQQDDKSDTI